MPFDDPVQAGYSVYVDDYWRRRNGDYGFRVGSPIELLPALLLTALSGAIAIGFIVLPIARIIRATVRGGPLAGTLALVMWRARVFVRRAVFLEVRLWWQTEGRALARRFQTSFAGRPGGFR